VEGCYLVNLPRSQKGKGREVDPDPNSLSVQFVPAPGGKKENIYRVVLYLSPMTRRERGKSASINATILSSASVESAAGDHHLVAIPGKKEKKRATGLLPRRRGSSIKASQRRREKMSTSRVMRSQGEKKRGREEGREIVDSCNQSLCPYDATHPKGKENAPSRRCRPLFLHR